MPCAAAAIQYARTEPLWQRDTSIQEVSEQADLDDDAL